MWVSEMNTGLYNRRPVFDSHVHPCASIVMSIDGVQQPLSTLKGKIVVWVFLRSFTPKKRQLESVSHSCHCLYITVNWLRLIGTRTGSRGRRCQTRKAVTKCHYLTNRVILCRHMKTTSGLDLGGHYTHTTRRVGVSRLQD